MFDRSITRSWLGTLWLFASLVLAAPARAAPPPAGTSPITDPAPGPAAQAESEEDVVETIDPATTPAPDTAVPTPSLGRGNAPPTLAGNSPAGLQSPPRAIETEHFELHGWARQSVELGLERPSQPSVTDPTLVPYDQVIGRTQLFVRARYSRARWFEANVSGALSYSILEQSPTRAGSSFNGINGSSARGVLEPRLHELFIGLFTSRLDVRVGQQRVAWGNSDFMSPNDVMNARDLRDPFVSETELRRIPTFMLRADLDLGFASLEALVEPVFTPDLYDVYGSNWAAIQPDAPNWARGVVGLARRSLDPTLQESAQRLLMATDYPKRDFTEPVVGARLSWSAKRVDVNYYYQYGFDGPVVNVDPRLLTGLSGIDFQHAGLVDLDPWLAQIDAGGHPLRTRYVRRHHVGVDLATTIGSMALRMDAAYESKRVFYRPDLLSVSSPTVEGVLSMEYQAGDKAKLALFELIYLHLVDPPDGPLLVYRRDSVALGADVRWPIWRALGLELRALGGILPRTAVVQPQLDLRFEHWSLNAGGLWLDGAQYSFGAHFHRNIETYLRAKVLF